MKQSEKVDERAKFVPAMPDLEQLIAVPIKVWIVGPGEAPPLVPGINVSPTHIPGYRLAWLSGGARDGETGSVS
jgi:hypothetical protein